MEKFRSFAIPSNHEAIDSKAGSIYGCSIAVAGEAAGHRLIFDVQSLRQLLDLGNRKIAGVKCRFTHPGLSSDGLGRFLGRVSNFRFLNDRLLGDIRLSSSARHTPNGNLYDYILDLASEDPTAFGVSVVVDLEKVWITPAGEVKASQERPRDASTKYPVARILSFSAADLVDEPALNPQGLFTASGDLVASNQVAEEVYQELDNYIHFLGFSPEKAYQFSLRYFQSRGVNLDKGETMSEPQAVYSTDEPTQAQMPAEPAAAQVDETAAQVKALQQEIFDLKVALTHAAEKQVVKLGPIPPRPSLSFGPSGLDHFQSAFDWVFGVEGSKLPPPELRRTDQLYRILTGDIGWHGTFDPAYAFAGANSTTLADLAANAMNKVIVELYDRLTHYRWYEMITAVQPTDGSLQDMAWIQFGGVSNLPVVAEGAAYTELTVADSKESDAFTKYGGYVGITDKMIRNSEIAKMQAIPRALTISAIQTRSNAIAGIFTANSGTGPVLDQDSTALFHANHANLATTAYSWTAWKAARLECAKQTELGSSKRQMLFPKFLLVPADLYDSALIDFGYGSGPGGRPGVADNDVNPYGMDRPGDPRPVPVAVPEFTDLNDWGYIVDPKIAPVLCMAYANNPGGRSHPAPELFTVTSPLAGLIFTNDTIPIKIRDWFAYGVATFRGIGKRNVA